MKFSDVIGQEEVAKRLIRMVEEDRLPHALLLCGPEGSGKMALALAFASYLLSDAAPQQASSSASLFGMEPEVPQRNANADAMLAKYEHPDLHFTFPVIRPAGTSSEHKMVSDDFIREWRDMLLDGPYFTMDQWLEQMNAANQQAQIGAGESDSLIRKLSLKSSQGGYKVSIIWLPERMNIECANKLLKLIEEPPQQTVFIMVSEEPEKLLETIRSRVQRIDIKKTDNESIRQALIERRGIDEDAARRIARLANGNWIAAVEELQADSEKGLFLDMYKTLMRLAYQRKIKDLRKWSEQMAAMGREKQRRWLTYFLRMTRESFVYNFQEEDLNYMTSEEEAFANNFARFINENNILPISDLANLALRDIGQNANAKIVFFDFALQTIVLLLPK